MRIRTFGYLLREACRGLSRNGLMAVAAAGTITVSLLIMGLFAILVTNLNFFGDRLKAQIQLRVFLAPEVSLEEAEGLREKIKGFKEDGVRKVRLVTKEEAAAEMEKLWGVPELFSGLGENPLPNTLVVELGPGAKIERLVRKIKTLPGVAEIVYRDLIRSLLFVAQIVSVVGVTLILVVSLGVLYIVVNTVRLTVFARRREIEIMKLVGATDWFIRWPFVLEGMILGLVGATVAAVILSKAYYFLFKSASQIAWLPLVPEAQVNRLLLLVLFPAGIFFGVAGSLLSVKRFLHE